MIQPKSIIIGVLISIILIKYLEYDIFNSKVLSSLFYIIVFSFLFDMINNNKGIILEGYTTNNDKQVNFIDFEDSDSFKGKRDGYVFKKGEKGLGYYLDKINKKENKNIK